MQIYTNVVAEQNREDDSAIKVGTAQAVIKAYTNETSLAPCEGPRSAELINDAAFAGGIAQRVCFMPCVVATGSWGAQLAAVTGSDSSARHSRLCMARPRTHLLSVTTRR